jgi:hypothetical protein
MAVHAKGTGSSAEIHAEDLTSTHGDATIQYGGLAPRTPVLRGSRKAFADRAIGCVAEVAGMPVRKSCVPYSNQVGSPVTYSRSRVQWFGTVGPVITSYFFLF